MQRNTETVASGSAAVVAKALQGAKLQLVAETYGVLKSGIRVSHDEMRTIFAEWNRGELADSLLGRAADILGLRDPDGDPLLEKVLDVARGPELCGPAAALALKLGLPAPIATQAAFSSFLSSMKDARVDASAVLSGPKAAPTGERRAMIEELRKALHAAFILAYAESHSLLVAAGSCPDGALSDGNSSIASLIAEAGERCGPKDSLLLDAKLKSSLDSSLPSLRRLCSRAAEGGLTMSCHAAALGYYDGLRSMWLPSNMVVALRDSIEGSRFERVDRPRGELFHSEWK